jgi:dolichol-phosphate mannosyltransferase
MDCDFSHDPADVPRLLHNLDKADLVIGSRYSHGISVINWPLRRLLLSIAANTYARLITGLPYKDATAGFRAWQASTLRAINLSNIKDNGYAFQIVTLFRAHAQGSRIIEVPIIFTERREGQSKMSGAIVREGIWIAWRLRLFGR